MTNIDTSKVTAGSKITTPAPSITQQLSAKVAASNNAGAKAETATEPAEATSGVEVISVAPEPPVAKNETIIESSVVPEATKAVETIRRMVTDVPLPSNTPDGVVVFISAYPKIEVGIEVQARSERDGRTMVRTSRNVAFKNGVYRTSDEEEIMQLRALAEKTVYITEQKTARQTAIVEQTNKALTEQRQKTHAGLATSANGGSDSELAVHASLSDMQKKALQ